MWILQPVRHRVLSIQESLWIAGERSLWRFGSLPSRLTRVIGRGLSVLSSRGIRWRCSLLSWISASLTRRTVVTATGTVPRNPCVLQATGSILPISLSADWSLRSHCQFALSICLHCVTACSVWLRIIFHPDLYCLAAINLYAFISLDTWLWLA